MKIQEAPRPQSAEPRRHHRLANRGGAVLVFVALGLVVFLGIAALAVDLGLLYLARGEAQRAADAAAHAGAGFYQLNRNRADAVQATRDFVVEFAENNEVRGLPVRVDGQQDIDVLPAEGLVRVRVRRTDDGLDGPIPTLFARVLGFREVGVSASAAAQIFGARAAGCMLPVALPDRWARADGSFPGPFDTYEPEDGDFYDQDTTGYRLPDDLGASLLIRPPTGGGGPRSEQSRITPSWWGYTWSPPSEFDFSGQDRQSIGRAINNCEGRPLAPGDEVETSQGAMAALAQDFRELYLSDSSAQWNDALGCVTDIGESTCRTSLRLRPMVLFSPDLAVGGPTDRLAVTRIVGVFVEEPVGSGANFQVPVRLVSLPSTFPGDIPAGPGDFVTAIRIIE